MNTSGLPGEFIDSLLQLRRLHLSAVKKSSALTALRLVGPGFRCRVMGTCA